MTSKEALEKLSYISIYEEDIDIIFKGDLGEVHRNEVDIISKDLDRLEELEKVIKFLKLNFNISLDSKLRISDDSECVQTFITYLPENTTIDEMFKTLKEVIEDE